MISSKNIFLFVFYMISVVALAQRKGRLEININNEYETNNTKTKSNIDYFILKNDTVRFEFHGQKLETEWIIDSITEGNYSLKINVDSNILLVFNGIIIKPNRINVFDLNFATDWYRYDTKNDTTKVTVGKSDATINTMFGSNSIFEKATIKSNQSLSLDAAINYYEPIANCYSIGFKFGGQYTHTNFDNDTSSYLGSRILNKYYSTASIGIGYINRFTFFNNKFLYSDGLKLDIGIVYNFPIFFKQIEQAKDHKRITTSRINTYKDFSIIGRLGYKYFGIQAEYSLFDFLKTKYTEPPKLKIGIVFYIPTAN